MDNYFGQFTNKDFIMVRPKSNAYIILDVDVENKLMSIDLTDEFKNALILKADYCDTVMKIEDKIKAENIKYEDNYGQMVSVADTLKDLLERVGNLERR